MITQRERILAEVIRTAPLNPDADNQAVFDLVAEKLGIGVELVQEAMGEVAES